MSTVGSIDSSDDDASTTATIGSSESLDKRTVYVQVNFIKVGEINTLKETFDAHLIIKSRWREPALDGKKDNVSLLKLWNPQISIENAVGDPQMKYMLSMERNKEETFVVEKKKFRGTFVELMELWDFPFDVQDLSILIKSETSIHETELVEDPVEMHTMNKRSFADKQEFYLYRHILSSVPPLSVDQEIGIVKQKSPRLKVTINVARWHWYFIWNVFLLMNAIVAVSFTTFAISVTLLANRLQIGVVLFLTAVTFKTLINSHIPRISYFTYIDAYVVPMMILLAAVSCWHGFMTRVAESQRVFVDRVGLCCFGVVYILFHAIYISVVLARPFANRRRMELKERDYLIKYSKAMNSKVKTA